MRVVGIDLAGSGMRDTGYCFMERRGIRVETLHGDEEILSGLIADRPEIVAVDAPLSLPKGRRSIDERDSHHFRQCDLALRGLGIRFFPITLGPMRMLTKRGMALEKKILEILPKARVIEVYPGAAYDILGVERRDKKAIRSLFRKCGIVLPGRTLSQDELDGICCALTGRLYLEGAAEAIGDKSEGTIVIPKVKKV
jgi:predicted nuclease with RNAse H fold